MNIEHRKNKRCFISNCCHLAVEHINYNLPKDKYKNNINQTKAAKNRFMFSSVIFTVRPNPVKTTNNSNNNVVYSSLLAPPPPSCDWSVSVERKQNIDGRSPSGCGRAGSPLAR